jgi:ArsR family transcriptional regulator, virulence genes transcriptional regulator
MQRIPVPPPERKEDAIMNVETRQIASTLKVLANENRLAILCELLAGPETVGALLLKIGGISQSALSQHLALLKAHGMVADRKSGQNVTYCVADGRVEAVLDTIRRQYCLSHFPRGNAQTGSHKPNEAQEEKEP